MTASPARHPLAPAFPVMAAVFVGYLVVGMALPVLPLHVHDDLGFGPFVVGLVSGGQFLAALVSRLWAGHLADTRGSRHAVLAGLAAAIGGGGCYLLSLLFTSQPVVAVGIILVGRILLGGAESLVITGGISWALALLPPQMAGKAIAWVGMAMFAAMAAGSPLGDLVYRHTGFGGIAKQICLELKIHTLIEEEIFYPAFRGKIEDDTLDEAYVEHDGAKLLINDISAASPEDDFYDAKVTVLAEEIKHHVHEEEMPSEGMFAQCRKTDVDLVALRDQMAARKQELMRQAKAEGLPPAVTTALKTELA